MIYWTQDFTAANGSTWDEVGFTRVAGAAINATIQGNAGWCGATPGLRFYRSSGYPPTRDHRVEVEATWLFPTVQGRGAGVMARMTGDGATCYWADLSSYRPSGGLIGTPHVRLFRRRLSAQTTLVAETDISASVSAADLAAGVRIRLRVKNVADGEVNVQFQVDRGAGFVTYADYTDTAGSGVTIEDNGTCGIVIDGLSSLNDVVYDNFKVTDFEDEAVTVDYQTGVGLVVNGVYYNEDEVEALGLGNIRARQSYGIRADGEITDLSDFHDPALRGGDDISILFNNTFLASGVIRPMVKSGRVPVEGVSYEIHGPKLLCQGVVVNHPTTNAGQITFNPDPEEPNYDSGLANKTIGDLLEWLYDNHAEGDDGLRAHRAAPAYGQIVTIPGALLAGPVIPGITLSGDFASAVEMLLSYMPAWAWYIDPETKAHSFHERTASATVDIDTNDDWVEVDVEVHPELNRTAVLVRGGEREVEMVTLSMSGGTLAGDWDAGLETTWTNAVSRRSKATGTIIATGTGPLSIDPDQTGGLFPMEVNEWQNSIVTFTSGAENGNTYQVVSNTLLRLVLYGAAWISTGPIVGDTFVVEDKQSNTTTPDSADPGWTPSYNGQFSVYRQFAASGAQAGIELAEGKCFDIRITTPLPGGLDDQFEVRHVGGKVENGKIVLDAAATLPLGLTNYGAGRTGDVCEPGGAEGVGQNTGNIEVDAPKRNATVPRLRRPLVGFTGTAYSFDPAKWDGGGEAGYGDYGVRTLLVVDDPNYNSTAFTTEYQAFADALLEVYSALAVMGRVDFNDKVDVSWAGLDRKVTLTDTPGGRTTGYESADYLWLAEAEWDLSEHRTSLNIGNIAASGGLNLQALRSRYAETNRMKQWRDAVRKQADFLNCMKSGFQSATAAEITGSQGLCATQISAGGGESVADKIVGHSAVTADIATVCNSSPCVDLCPGGLVSNPAQMLTNAADAVAVRPTILKPDGTYSLPAAGVPPGQPAGDWIENVVACIQGHVEALWVTLHDQTTAVEAAFKQVENCFVDKETDIGAVYAALVALYNCHNALYRQVVATFGTVMAGPGVPLLPDPGGPGVHCPNPTVSLHVCGGVCECQITVCPIECNP